MDNTEQQSRHEKWKAFNTEYEKSNLSQAAFCKQHNLSPAQFGYYRSLLKSKSAKITKKVSTFAPVKINPSSNTAEIRLTLPNGFHCVFPSDMNKAKIKELVEIHI